MEILNIICKELGVEVGKEWLGNDDCKYIINEQGSIFEVGNPKLSNDDIAQSNWKRVIRGELRPLLTSVEKPKKNELLKILRVIEINNSWKDSFYRYTGDGHFTPLIKYFSCRYDTRDMNCWGIEIDLKNRKFFRIDTEEDFERLIEFLKIRKYDKEKHTHMIKDSFQIYGFVFNIHEVQDNMIYYTESYVTVCK